MAFQESKLHDRISELPIHILTEILSLLTLKEAGQTCVLSKRWRHLWAYYPTLNFVNFPTLKSVNFDYLVNYDSDRTVASLVEEESKYFRFVDRVVTLHRGPTIDEFKVQFDLQESRKENVDNWIKFAMEKRVKRFLLDIAPITSIHRSWTYAFPSLPLCNSLTSLQLGHVDVMGEDLEKLLCDCPLEHLSLVGITSLVSLKVAGPSLALKSLRMYYCNNVKHLEIYAPNLISFDYSGPKLSLPFKSTPKLSDVSVDGFYGRHLIHDFSDLLGCSSQIEALTMDSFLHEHIAKIFPAWTRLKTLHIKISLKTDDDLFGLLSLLKHCPLLHKFVLELISLGFEVERPRPADVEAHCHYNLKIVEIFDFVGWVLDIGFAKYLMENAVSLERITIHPRNQQFGDDDSKLRRAEQRAEQLRAYVKLGTEFKICEDTRKPPEDTIIIEF